MCLLIIASALLFSVTTYYAGHKALSNGVDNKLRTAARLGQEILTPTYHDSIINATSVTAAEYAEIVARWNRLCEELDLEYIWSLAKIDDQIVFTSGTSTSKSLEKNDFAQFFEPHTNPELYIELFDTMEPKYRITEDKWGRIRAVIIPFNDVHGRPYLVAASMKMTDVDAMITQLVRSCLYCGAVILALGVLLSIKFARSLSLPIEQINETAQRITRGELASASVEIKGSKEIRSLAQNINIMEKTIDKKIAELRLNEENLRITLRSIGDGVIATDTNGRVTRMNFVAERITQWPERDALGKPLSTLFNIIHTHTRIPVPMPTEKVLTTGEIFNLVNHTSLIARDGSEVRVSVSGAPIRSINGEILGGVLVFQDVTAEQAMQDQLLRNQKIDTIGRLAGSVAHDFNNLLSGIMSATDLLEIRIPPSPEHEKYLHMITGLCQRAADLTGKLLAFAHKQSGTLSVINAHDPLTDSVALLRSSIDPRTKIQLDLQADHSTIIGDSSQWHSCILNLGINALHAMPEGGTLCISTRQKELTKSDGNSSVVDLPPGPYIEITISDTGTGIGQDDIGHIFEPFFTTKEHGTGLGLATVLGTIQYYKGSITVESELGAGTRFNILLPLTDESYVIPTPLRYDGSRDVLILVVDDESIMRDTTAALLNAFGYNTHVAEDGLAGFNRFKKEPYAYDLVILDMIMPKMNGRDCYTAMRQIRPDVPVILCTGFAREQDIQNMQDNGLRGVIRKPFRAAELNQVVSTVLATSPHKA